MISFKPFFNLIASKGLTKQEVIDSSLVSKGTLFRMQNNKPVNTDTLNIICNVLGCGINDIMDYTPDILQKSDGSDN